MTEGNKMGEDFYYIVLRSLKRSKLISGVILAVLGIMFLFAPLTSMVTVCQMIGWVALIGGIIQVIGAVTSTPGIWMKNPYVYYGIFLAVFGAVIAGNPYILLDWVNLLFGLLVSASSAVCLLNAQQIRRVTEGNCNMITILSIAGIILGVLIILNPFGTVTLLSRMIGIILIYGAVVQFKVFRNIKNVGDPA